ncbi:MAG TPA: hypothetical protein VFN74_24580 [Chloroflexota bacterium]|nr:hypothetical protein [Chloroflexota bacterium]
MSVAGLVSLERCAGMRFGEERDALTEMGRGVLAGAFRDVGDER